MNSDFIDLLVLSAAKSFKNRQEIAQEVIERVDVATKLVLEVIDKQYAVGNLSKDVKNNYIMTQEGSKFLYLEATLIKQTLNKLNLF